MANALHRVVIIGGGFGGLHAACNLRTPLLDVTLIDRRNFHLFQPLLYQVATGGLSPANISAPLRGVVRRQRNCRVLLGEVKNIDLVQKQVFLDDEAIPYDSLIVAAGAQNFYFGHPEWEQHAPGLKSIEDATEIRRKVLTAFEAAERYPAPDLRARFLTFVIVGGGPTGVEMAGAVGELAHETLRRDFRSFDPASARIILMEGTDRILPPFAPSLSASAKRTLERRGIEVWTSSRVLDIQADHVMVHHENQSKRVDSSTVIWAAGVSPSPLGKKLGELTGANVDRTGRVFVEPDLTLKGHPNIFAIGDVAANLDAAGKPLPGLAPVAMQQGRYVAKLINRRIEGKTPPNPFHYWDKGTMATIGRNAAVVEAYGIRFSGFIAWLAWLFIHILYLIQFQNRIMVMLQWFWNYWTRNRSARLITGELAKHGKLKEQ